jgi:hypothetical protein
MQVFHIFRMKDTPRQHFRWAPHTSGVTMLKPKDFEPAGEVEASTAYAAWHLLQSSEQPLQVGDLLESAAGELRIYKYVGFEEAKWVLPEVKPGLESAPLVVGDSSVLPQASQIV